MTLTVPTIYAGDYSNSYHQEATVQKSIAAELAKSLGKRYPDCKPAHIVEIGSGTGFLTEYLIELFPEATIVATDKSRAMLATTKHALNQFDKLHYLVHDWNNGWPDDITTEKTSLLTSSMVLHWLDDWADSADKWSRHAERISLAMMAKGSLTGWEEWLGQFSGDVSRFNYPAVEDITSKLSKSWVVEDCYTKTYEMTFPSIWAFICHLKTIGMGHGKSQQYMNGAFGKLRQLRQQAVKGTATPYAAEYTIIFVTARTRHNIYKAGG
jgi:SAM-dependent methyltransferase